MLRPLFIPRLDPATPSETAGQLIRRYIEDDLWPLGLEAAHNFAAASGNTLGDVTLVWTPHFSAFAKDVSGEIGRPVFFNGLTRRYGGSDYEITLRDLPSDDCGRPARWLLVSGGWLHVADVVIHELGHVASAMDGEGDGPHGEAMAFIRASVFGDYGKSVLIAAAQAGDRVPRPHAVPEPTTGPAAAAIARIEALMRTA